MCTTGERLIVKQGIWFARVQIAGVTYKLKRRRSSIGLKYISSAAALIIDGPSTVFVADDGKLARTCVPVLPNLPTSKQ